MTSGLPPVAVPPEERHAILEEEHLRLLVLMHKICAGMMAAGGAILLAFAAMFVGVLILPPLHSVSPGVSRSIQLFAVFVFAGLATLILVHAWLTWCTAVWLRTRRLRRAIIVMSVSQFLLLPHGTLLGMFTLIVLQRPSVRAQFADR